MESNVDQHVVDNNNHEEHSERDSNIQKCKFYIEPVLLFSSLVGFPRFILDPLLLYHLIAQDIKGNRTDLNISQLQMYNVCDVNKSDPEYKFREEIQQNAALYTIYQNLATSIPAVFVALFLGAYSDKAGRKYALIPPQVGGCLGFLLVVFIILFHLPTWVLIISSFLMGCGGNYQTFVMACFAYIADTSKKEDRPLRMIINEMLIYACGIVGYIGVGYWVQKFGFLWPYVLICSGKFLVILVITFLVPETITADANAKFFTLEHLVTSVKMINSKLHPSRRTKLLILLGAFFLPTMVSFGDPVDTLFELNVPLCWDPEQLGRFNAVFIAAISIGGILGTKLFKLCLSDIWLAVLSGTMAMSMDIYRSFVSSTLMMYMVPIFGLLMGIFIPMLRALMSNQVEDEEQGSLFGGQACIELVCSVVGATLFSAVYAGTISFMRGFVYLVNAAFYLIAVILLLIFYIFHRPNKNYEQFLPDTDGTIQ